MTFFADRVQPVSPQPGESGYFSAPAQGLDPRLFTGKEFRPAVREWVLSTLYGFWNGNYNNPRAWSTVWVAGSGISYQWQASRGNGDLDILIGVDFSTFFRYNEKFSGLSEHDMADIFNSEFHASLWPQTAQTQISEGSPPHPMGVNDIFEVTFYVNPDSADIRNIHPYAAYDLTHNAWTVEPPSGNDFHHPRIFYKYAEEEAKRANSIVAQYNSLAGQVQGLTPGTPGYLNVTTQAGLVAEQAKAMFDDIHLGRHHAFSQGGKGYGDYYNFRWQYHKNVGTVQALRAVGEAYESTPLDSNRQPVEGADVVLRRAALWNRGGNGH